MCAPPLGIFSPACVLLMFLVTGEFASFYASKRLHCNICDRARIQHTL